MGPASTPINQLTPIQTFSKTASELIDRLNHDYPAIRSALSVGDSLKITISQSDPIDEIPPLLEGLRADITQLEIEIRSFTQPTYHADAALLESIHQFQTEADALEHTFHDQEQAQDRKIRQLEAELEELRRQVESKKSQRTVDLEQHQLELERQIRENAAKLKLAKEQKEEEEGTCKGSFFSCCDTKLKNLKKQIEELNKKDVEITGQPTPLATTPEIDEFNQKIQDLIDAVATARTENTEVNLAGKAFREKQIPLQELIGFLKVSESVVNNIVSNRIMFLALRTYEKFLQLEIKANQAILWLLQPATLDPTHSPRASFASFITKIKEGISKLWDILKNLFCPHSGDYNGEYFHEAFQEMSPQRRQAILASSEIPDDLIPSENGQILFEQKERVQGMVPLPEEIAPLPTIHTDVAPAL